MKLALLLLVACAACASTDHCDPDQVYSHGLCYEVIADAPPRTSDASFAHYGDTCVDPGLCAAPTDYCMIEFGGETGYCTSTGCASAADCPGGWQCTDLSVFIAGAPHVCTH